MKITKITIEYSDNDPTIIPIEKGDSVSLSMNSGFKSDYDDHGNPVKSPNGVRVLKILVGPDYLLNEINRTLESDIESIVNL